MKNETKQRLLSWLFTNVAAILLAYALVYCVHSDILSLKYICGYCAGAVAQLDHILDTRRGN